MGVAIGAAVVGGASEVVFSVVRAFFEAEAGVDAGGELKVTDFLRFLSFLVVVDGGRAISGWCTVR